MLAHKFSYKQGLPLYAHNFFYKFQALLVKGSSVYLRRFDEPLTFKKADSKFIDFVAKGIIVDQSNVELVLKKYMEKRSQPTYMHSIIKNIIMEEQKPLKSEYATISEYKLSNRNVGILNTNITINSEMMVKLSTTGIIKSTNDYILKKSVTEIVKEVLDYNIKGYDTEVIAEIGKILDMNYRYTGFTLNDSKQLGSPDINISDYQHDKNISIPLLGKGLVKGEDFNVSNAKEVISPSITEYSNFNKSIVRPTSQITISNSVIPIKRPELSFISKHTGNETLERNINVMNEYGFSVHLENDSVLDIYKANTQQKYVSKTTTFDAFKEKYRTLMPVYFIKNINKTYNVKFITHGIQSINEIGTSINMNKGSSYGLRIGKHNGISVVKNKYDINKFINSVIGLDYQNYPNKIIDKNGRVIQAQHIRPIDSINIHREHIFAEKISHRSSGLLPSLKFVKDITNPIIDKRLHDDSIHYLDEISFDFIKVIDPKMLYNDTLRPIDSCLRESLTKALDKTFTVFEKQGSFKYFDKTPYRYYKNGEYKFLDEPTIDIYLNTSYKGFNTPHAELFRNNSVVNIKHRGQELDKDDSKYVKLTDDVITLVETQFLNNGNQVMEIIDKQTLLNSTFKPKIQIQSGALLKENRKTDLRKHVTEKSNFYLFPTNVKKITKHETEKEEKWLDWTERWWFIQSTGEKIHLDIPDIDYPYETSKVMGEDKHPIQPFKGKGERNIAVSMEIVIEMVNITLHWWSHSFGSLVNGFGHEVMQAYFRVLEKWMNLDHSKEILKNLDSVEDYNRVIRWLRWEAEKVYFLSRQDEENKLLHHGNYYMEIFTRNLLDFLEYHYYTILPLHGNLDRMDIMRNIMGVDSNPQGDIIDKHRIDKVLSAKDYMLNTDDNII